MRTPLFLTVLALLATACGGDEPKAPEIVTEAVAYQDGDVELEGYLAYDKNRSGKQPGVLVIHEWWGLGEHPKARARALAELGYVAFAPDMYGKGKLTEDPKQAQEWAVANFYGDMHGVGRARIEKGLEVLTANDRVDTSRLAAIGFCFGGSVALELAWSGAPLDGVVSFHGQPTEPRAEDVAGVKAEVLLCHGADDPLVPQEKVQSFEKALTAAKIPFKVVQYPGAVHSFTNPAADGSWNPGVKYNEAADKQSWKDMRALFAARLGK